MEIGKNISLKCLVCRENKGLNVSFNKNTKVICSDCIAAMQGIILQNAELEAINNSQYFRQTPITDWKITNNWKL